MSASSLTRACSGGARESQALLKDKHRERIDAYFQRAIAEREIPEGRRLMRDYERFALWGCFLNAFTSGFTRVTSRTSGIHCEMLVYYTHFRVSILYGLWIPWMVSELLYCLETLGSVVHDAPRDIGPDESKSVPIAGNGPAEPPLKARTGLISRVKRLLRAVHQIADRFLETLGCAIGLNLLFWFMTAWLQWGNDDYNASWGFVRDVFGFCAGSGYMDAFGYSCIP